MGDALDKVSEYVRLAGVTRVSGYTRNGHPVAGYLRATVTGSYGSGNELLATKRAIDQRIAGGKLGSMQTVAEVGGFGRPKLHFVVDADDAAGKKHLMEMAAKFGVAVKGLPADDFKRGVFERGRLSW